MQTQEITVDRERFDEQGYVVVEAILSREDLQAIHDEYAALLDSLIEQWHAEGKLASTYRELPFSQRFTTAIAAGLPVMDYLDISLPPMPPAPTERLPIHQGPAVFHLLRHPRLLDAVEQIIGPEIYCNPVQHVRIKPPENLVPEDKRHSLVASVDWHQDAGVVTADADETDLLSVWIAITDATLDNSCLVMIPGSHKHNHEEVVLHCYAKAGPEGFKGARQLTIPSNYRGLREPTPVPIRAGDAILFHRRTMHSSMPNVSDSIRWSFDLRYNPIGQHSGRSWYPGFIARSRAHPETELRGLEGWKRLWEEAQDRLIAEGGTPAFNRWRADDPRCA